MARTFSIRIFAQTLLFGFAAIVLVAAPSRAFQDDKKAAEHNHDHDHDHDHGDPQAAAEAAQAAMTGDDLDPEAATIDETDQSVVAVTYRKTLEDLRQFLKDARKVIVEFHVSRTPASDEHLKKWLEACEKGRKKIAAVRTAQIALYTSNPSKYKKIGDTLYYFAKQDLDADRAEGTLEVMKALIDGGYDGVSLFENAGKAAYANNEFDLAADFLRKASALNPNIRAEVISGFSAQAEKWKEELVKREKEASADDLPRVELLTTKGNIEIELFEDDAPETVINFIYLVEKGHYNAKPIFRVVPHLVAQTGCERGDGTGTPGYSIKGEGNLPNHRNHFRGSVGLALGATPGTNEPDLNSGSAQFYISFAPLPQFDGSYCVFGRVIKGLDILGNFARVDMSNEEEKKKSTTNPDAVVRARVIRKRNHEYRPTPIEGRLLD